MTQQQFQILKDRLAQVMGWSLKKGGRHALLKLCKQAKDFRVIRCLRSAFAQIAVGAGQHHVLCGGFSSCRGRKDVVQMKDPTIVSKELENPAFRNPRLSGSSFAVLANTFVSFSDFVSYRGRDISTVRHTISTCAFWLATRYASYLKPTTEWLQTSALNLVEQMLQVKDESKVAA